MSFIKKSIPPPKLREGDIVQARILDVIQETSKWEDDNGDPKEQLRFDLELSNGYNARAWIAYYERPSDKSVMGAIALKLSEMTGTDISSADEFIEKIKNHGQVFVKVKGFREYKEETYPKLSIYPDQLPLKREQTRQQPLSTGQSQ